MSQLVISRPEEGKRQPDIAASNRTWYLYMSLPAIALAVDVLSPQLVSWRLLPGQVRWIGDAAVAAMLAIALLRMLLTDRIPRAFLVIVAVSLLGVTVALFEGQSLGATAYGWWRMFMFPMVGLYAYMVPYWPKGFPKWFMWGCLVVLAFETIFQTLQYLTGTTPGDYLAGSFGPHGVGPLIMSIVLILCFGLGIWLAKGDFRYLALALILGAVSSMLGEMKLFPVAVVTLSSLALLVRTIKGGSARQLLILLLTLIVAVSGFFYIYNNVTAVAAATGNRLQDYADPTVLNRYLSTAFSPSNTSYNLGRNFDVLYAWDQIQFDTVRLLLGRGIGSRTISGALGFTGQAVRESLYGSWTGRSLTVFMQETGMLGLLTLAGFAIAVSAGLYRRAWRGVDEMVQSLQLGLMLFSLLWPLWLWYLQTWGQPVPMLLYWIALGYSFSDSARSNQESDRVAAAANRAVPR